MLAQAEQTQLAIARKFQPTDAKADKRILTMAQQGRERGAEKGLAGVIDKEKSLETLNVFCKRSKVQVDCDDSFC